jgi:hypothetical protein
MEYLDPKRQKRHRLTLIAGYLLVSLGIIMGTAVLLWEAYGFGVKNGQVIQDGMVFLSSQPNPTSIYINGVLNAASTNTRLTIPSATYKFELQATGYRPWYHWIEVMGGQVIHYDYPLLVPSKLTSKTISVFNTAPAFASQSPSQQYLVIPDATNFGTFEMYDLTSPSTAPVTLTLPSSLLTPAQTTQSWKVVGWADDNQHLLLEHLYNGTSEFIELDTQNPTQSININKTFNINPTSVTLNNLKYNQFYFYDAANQTLSSASIGSPTVTQVETNVLSFKSYLSNSFLYVTSNGAPAGQVAVELDVNGKYYFVRDLPASSTYMLNMASYNGDTYGVVGASSSKFVYLYQDMITQTSSGNGKITPYRAILMPNPTYDSFAPTAQFVLVESGSKLAIYDILNDEIYHYVLPMPIDPPQTNVTWMDGDRLVYVSGGNLLMADYDNTNQQTLTPAMPGYQSFFAPDYHSYFTLVQKSAKEFHLNQTSLLAS